MYIRKVMMADDDSEDVDIFKDVLTDLALDLQLEVAVNGIELMEMLKTTKIYPEIIFLDLNMPFKNGMLCLHEIKTNPVWKNIKVIMLSTSSHEEQIKAAYAEGADFYMVKSTSYMDFKNAVSACMHKNWHAQENNN